MIVPTDPRSLRAKIKENSSHVGRLKGSFIPAREFFGNSSTPKWIKSNSDGYFKSSGDWKGKLSMVCGSKLAYGNQMNNNYSLVARVYASKARDFENMIKKDVINRSLKKNLT